MSVLAADDPITCAAYAKEKNLYNLDGLIKKEKQLTRAIKQSKIRQVRHAKKYMFGFLIPRNYTEALGFDKANNKSKWYDGPKAELDSIHSYQVFQTNKSHNDALIRVTRKESATINHKTRSEWNMIVLTFPYL